MAINLAMDIEIDKDMNMDMDLDICKTSVVDPKLFFPDPTLTLISDPDSDMDPDLNPDPACL